MDKYSDFPSQIPYMRPKSAIYTPKQDNEHPSHFYMGVSHTWDSSTHCIKLICYYIKRGFLQDISEKLGKTTTFSIKNQPTVS